MYLTSRTNPEEIEIVRRVLEQYDFPQGELFYRREGEEYKDVAERVLPQAPSCNFLSLRDNIAERKILWRGICQRRLKNVRLREKLFVLGNLKRPSG